MTTAQEFERRRWIALALLAMAQFVVVLDASIVNVALPTIGEALDFSESNLPWVVNAYVLTFGGFLLLGGRLADLLGRRRVFMAGLVLFAIASLAGGLASNSGQLIAARAVQGLGAAILSPAALSIVATTFRDGAERNKALGIWGAVAGSGGAAGVLPGGVLTDTSAGSGCSGSTSRSGSPPRRRRRSGVGSRAPSGIRGSGWTCGDPPSSHTSARLPVPGDVACESGGERSGRGSGGRAVRNRWQTRDQRVGRPTAQLRALLD